MIPIENTKKKHPGGRPRKQIDKKTFCDLLAIGCEGDEICWFFRDDSGRPICIDTLSDWCKREFGCSFSEYKRQNSGMLLKIQLRRNQFELSKKSAAMAIFLGKNWLGQTDEPRTQESGNELLESLMQLERDRA